MNPKEESPPNTSISFLEKAWFFQGTKVGQAILGYEIIGGDNDLENLAGKYDLFFITIGHMGSPARRIALSQILDNLGATQPTMVASTARISPHAEIGAGTIVHHQALVNSGAVVGKGCIINSGALVEHDVLVGDFCHISTRAVLNGNVRVGESSFVGSGAVVLQGVTCGESCSIGAGSVVLKDVVKGGRCNGFHGVAQKEFLRGLSQQRAIFSFGAKFFFLRRLD